jgi:hypothetical protein
MVVTVQTWIHGHLYRGAISFLVQFSFIVLRNFAIVVTIRSETQPHDGSEATQHSPNRTSVSR